MKEKTTKAKHRKPGGDEMRAEYDFSKAVRGKYYKRVAASTNVIVLDPDVAESFKKSKVVNEALRNLLQVTDATARSSGRGKKARCCLTNVIGSNTKAIYISKEIRA